MGQMVILIVTVGSSNGPLEPQSHRARLWVVRAVAVRSVIPQTECDVSTPSDLAALLQKTQRLMHTGQLAAAAACLDQAAATGGTDQQIDVLRAQVSGARQDPAGALEALDRVLAQDPGIPQLVFGRIHALYSLGRLDDALDAIAATEAAVGTPLRHNLNGLRVMCLQRHGTADPADS